MRTIRVLTGLAAAGALTLTACGGDPTKDPTQTEVGQEGGGDQASQPAGESGGQTSQPADGGGGDGTITVGSANFTESTILAEVYAQVLEDAGMTVEKKLEIGSRETYIPALEDGSIDLIPEYSGTLAAYVDKDMTATTEADLAKVLEASLPQTLEVLEFSEAENGDNVVVTRQTADDQGLQKISDLEGKAGDMVLGGPPEWQKRPQGVPGLKKAYGLEFKTFRPLAAGGNVTVQALKNGQVDAANVFTTDPAIEANDFVILEDDKDLFSAQNVVPLIAKKANDQTVTNALNKVSNTLTSEDLAAMNAAVLDGKSPEEVADAWVEDSL